MNTASTLEPPTGDPAQTDTLLADVEKNWNEFGKRDPLWAILTALRTNHGRTLAWKGRAITRPGMPRRVGVNPRRAVLK